MTHSVLNAIHKLESLPAYASIEWVNNEAWVKLSATRYVRLDTFLVPKELKVGKIREVV